MTDVERERGVEDKRGKGRESEGGERGKERVRKEGSVEIAILSIVLLSRV